MRRVAAIHQPNFFPWLGYFHKIANADVFVVLDDAQHVKTGGAWDNRVKLLVSGEPQWMTAPIRRTGGVQRIDEVQWASPGWRDRMLRSLTLNYGRCSYFSQAMDLVRPLVENAETGVAAFNLHALQTIAAALQLNTPLVPASALRLQGAGNERLVALVRAVDCDTYLVGGGSQGYRDDSIFAQAGVAVREQGFVHPQYEQRGTHAFAAGLSIIDALMNCGIDRTRALVGSR